MLNTLRRLVVSWWRRDAIRISPNEGRLLRMGCPCIVRVDGQEAMLEHRHEAVGETGPRLIFEGRMTLDGSRCCLEVAVDCDDVIWTIGSSSTCLDARDVMVFQMG